MRRAIGESGWPDNLERDRPSICARPRRRIGSASRPAQWNAIAVWAAVPFSTPSAAGSPTAFRTSASGWRTRAATRCVRKTTSACAARSAAGRGG
ncbi:hypothetical protein GDI2870 [Gluconacetobacter diazotrophicus PA1 5]|uniref:Uncharacterized protein n=1 Tax=Gluconacetobacter diazotrophicus (strain ATCC 49037 / DSM 5601 / CCUG 37298 / CIP 103539 / LMG 7603 / PAl5) TaxID=272568 RepID=A9HQY8_GLUDA|nr:hypothetical protein GDI2870 [Gluconacetobacter diazotrophicus PA1 5]